MVTTQPELSPETAPETLKELWVFPVAPEVCNLACTHCLYAASPQRKNSYRLTEEEFAELFGQVEDLGAATTNGLKPATTVPPQRGKDMTLMCDNGVAYSEGKYFPCPVLVKDPEAMLGTSMRDPISMTARNQIRQLKSRKDACAVGLHGST
jgi:sulfatase maturation enzyme AslB (radical SAM superfamily)